MTNNCVSITITLVKGAKLMTYKDKKNTHIKSEGQCNDKQVPQKN